MTSKRPSGSASRDRHPANRVSSQIPGILNKGIKVVWTLVQMEKVSVLLNLASGSLRTDSKLFLSRQEKWRITDPSAQTFIKLAPALGQELSKKITSSPCLCGTHHLECHFPWDDLCTAVGRVLYCWELVELVKHPSLVSLYLEVPQGTGTCSLILCTCIFPTKYTESTL